MEVNVESRVQYNKSSILFIPVTKTSFFKFKTLLSCDPVSLNTVDITSVVILYSKIL